MASDIKYRPEIDGLRALAVTAVMLYHLGEVFLGINLLQGGFLGVDIFFVISGYLISSIILARVDNGTFNLLDFYGRRVRRIIPVFIVVVLASLPFAWRLLLPEEMQQFAKSAVFSIFFVSNFWFFTNDPYWVEGLTRPLLHTWSLSVEEQFYLLVPGIFLFLSRWAKHWMPLFFVVFFLASLGYAHFASISDAQAAFFLLPSRMWEITAGILLAIGERSKKCGVRLCHAKARLVCGLGLAMIIVPLFIYSSKVAHPSLYTLIPVAGVTLIIAFARGDVWTARLLRQPLLVGLGLISYGLYLWHYPIFVFAGRFLEVPSALSAAGITFLSVALSIVTFFFVERPARKIYLVPFRRLAVTLIAILFVLLPALFYASIDGVRWRYPEFLLSQESMPLLLDNHVWSYAENPLYGNMILVGDSHMMAVAPELKKLALSKGFNFAVSNERGCQLIVDTRRVLRSTRRPTHCTESLQNQRLDFLRESPPSFVILGGRLQLILEEKGFDNKLGGKDKRMVHYMQNSDSSLGNQQQRRAHIREKYRETVEAILAMGHTVVLLYPIPEVGWHVPRKLASLVGGNWSNAKVIVQENPIFTNYKVFQSRTRRAYGLLDGIDDDSVFRVYPEKLFCNLDSQNICITHDQENVFYRDAHHPSAYGAALIAQQIIEVVVDCNSEGSSAKTRKPFCR